MGCCCIPDIFFFKQTDGDSKENYVDPSNGVDRCHFFFPFQDVLGSRTLNDRVLALLSNMDTYLQFASREPTSAWESQLSHFEAFFRKLPSVLPENVSLS